MEEPRKLLIVTFLDYGYYSNNRVHHLVGQFIQRFEKVTILYKKAYVPQKYSLLHQAEAFFMVRMKALSHENVLRVEVDPLFNHVEGLGLRIVGAENPYAKMKSRMVDFVKEALSNIGIVSDLATVPSFLFAYLLKVRWKADIFIGQGPWEVAIGYLLKKFGRIKVLVYDDFDYAPGYQHAGVRKAFVAALENFLIKKADVAISVGEMLARLREQETGRRVEIIPNGVNVEHFGKALDKKPHPPTLLYMGYVWQWSGIDLIMHAISEVKNDIPGIRFNVLGHTTPGYLAHMERMAGELQLGNSFSYLGNKPHEQLIDFLQEADIGMAVFMPIDLRKYAFSLKVVEYMAAGLPVIATAETESGYLVDRVQAGIVVRYDRGELSSAIRSLINDRAFYAKCQENAVNSGRGYEWKYLMDSYYSLMKDAYYGSPSNTQKHA
ncbi:MAG: glycosyltransferase family 4 protein [Nitrospirota bacterium]